MRAALFYNPRLLIERLAVASLRRRRLAKLRGTVASRLKLGHINSLELLELLRERSAPKVIYDIGANVGTWSLLAKAIFPEALIHAFEPLSVHCSGFADNLREVSGVTLHQIALGPAAATQAMEIAPFSDESSLLAFSRSSSPKGTLAIGRESVRVEKLDDYVRAHSLPLPDLIKLDVQGYELQVLEGAAECAGHAMAILTEVSFEEFYQGQCLFDGVVRFCAERSFRLLAFGPGAELGTPLTQTDALFWKESVLRSSGE